MAGLFTMPILGVELMGWAQTGELEGFLIGGWATLPLVALACAGFVWWVLVVRPGAKSLMRGVLAGAAIAVLTLSVPTGAMAIDLARSTRSADGWMVEGFVYLMMYFWTVGVPFGACVGLGGMLVRRWRYSGARMLCAILATALIAAVPRNASSASSPPRPKIGWNELARTPLADDTVIVRGLFTARMWDSTYTSYRIEHRDGRLWSADSLPGMTCDLSCRVRTLRGGQFIAALDAVCDPCFPGSCGYSQYVGVFGDSVVRSDWTEVEWSPPGDTAHVWVKDYCVAYSIPLTVRIGSRIDFAPGGRAGGFQAGEFRVEAVWEYCHVPAEADTLITIETYDDADEQTPQYVTLHPQPFEVRSAIVRIEGTSLADLAVDVLRIEVVLNGKQVFITPDTLKRMGFEDL